MAGFLPKDLIGLGARPSANDIFILEVDGESTVKKVTYNEFLPTGVANGVCPLDASNLVPSIHLPSYVDDVIEVVDFSGLPTTGETGKIYITLDDNKTHRWSGTAYLEIGSGLYASDIGVTIQPYDINTVVDASYVHTDNNFTTIEKTKLSGIEDNATADQTGAEIKIAYESELDTNAFTDSEKTKLGTATVSSDIGVTIQAYDINTVVDASYVPHSIAAAVADIVVDGSETVASNANKINELLASLRTAGLLTI